MTRLVPWHSHQGLVTDEIEIFGIVDDFCRKGDSGLLVTDDQEDLVGMVVGDDLIWDWDGAPMLLAWATREADIKKVTGGTLKLVLQIFFFSFSFSPADLSTSIEPCLGP